MRQKLLALLLALMLAFGGLTACGEDGAGENIPSEGQSEGQTEGDNEGGEGEGDD
jgi:predicted small lipoprotein YifL